MKKNNVIGALPIGTELQDGTYTIERVLGQGATGITYLAGMHQKLSGNLGDFSQKVQVAIKEFYFKNECRRESTTQNIVIANTEYDAKVKQFKKSFVKEAKRIAGLSHPNIVHVLSIFEENSTVYYVMQYIGGGSIKDLIEEKGEITIDNAVKYSIQIATALEYMHSKNMCHYDIKPGNIMLSDSGDAMLIDFGIAKNYDDNGLETSTTPPGLTKGYAPLELYTSVTQFSPKIDVYSLGATLYAMLTGSTPPEPMKWIGEPFTEKPATVPDWLWNVVRKTMSIDSKDRPTMKDFKKMLETTNDIIETSSQSYEDETQYEKPENLTFVAEQKKEPKSQAQPQPRIKGSSKNYLFYIMLIALGLLAGIGSYFMVSYFTDNSDQIVPDTTVVNTIYDNNGYAVMTFSGNVISGRPEGKGTLIYLSDKEKKKYEGTFVNGLREDSAALLLYRNGDIYRGAFEKDHLSIGTYFVKSTEERFQGKFKDDKPWNGAWYDKHENVISRVENGEEK